MAIKTRFHEDVHYAPRNRDEVIDLRHRRGRLSPPLDAVRGERHSRRRRRGKDEEFEEEFEIDIEPERNAGRHESVRHQSSPRRRVTSPSRIVERDGLVLRREESPGWKRVERDDMIARRDIDTYSEDSFDIEPMAPARHRHLVHEDILAHHKHNRHGHAPLHRRESPRRMDIEEIEIRRHDRHHRDHDDEGMVEIDADIHRDHEGRRHRARTHDPLVIRPREIVPPHIREEEQYSRHVTEGPSRSDAHRDTTHDWCILDVPPGTKRATVDGLGGNTEEILWQRRNGVRRSRFLHDGHELRPCRDIDVRGTVAKRYVGVKEKREELWTEITKDLVVKEAIEEAGYEYEETADFFYIFAYLQYDDVAELVKFSEDYRRRRRDRVREIQHERAREQPLPPPLSQPKMLLERESSRPLWDEERVHETEIIIDEGRRIRRRSPILRERIV
ncbi:hypothetical protein FQN49_001810 [Arthroderma sp. PD_2]|nr:hypothetical protein FQN49_001810 [Arthroderma sp. PD_2]